MKTGPTAWLSPAYPFILGTIFKLFGVYSETSALVALILNACFCTGTCIIVGLIAWHVGRDRLAVGVSAVLAGLAPSTVAISGKFWDTALSTLLFAACILSMIRLKHCLSRTAAVSTGVIGGLLFLANAASVLFIPVALVFVVARRWRRGWPSCALIACIMVAISAPWVLRNKLVVGKLEPRCCAGQELRAGNNEDVWEQGRTADIPAEHPWNDPVRKARYKLLGEVKWDDENMQIAQSYIRADLWRFAVLCERRIRDFWFGGFASLQGIGTGGGLVGLYDRLLAFLSITIVPIVSATGLIGIGVCVDRNISVSIPAAALLIYPVPMYVVSVNLRLQQPAQVVMMVFSGFLVSTIIRRLARNHDVTAGDTRARVAVAD
jgi:hypothetical protein